MEAIAARSPPAQNVLQGEIVMLAAGQNVRGWFAAAPWVLLLLAQSYVLAAPPGNADRRTAKAGADAAASPAVGSDKTLSLDLGGGVKMEFVWIPSGSFLMGDAEGLEDERPVHQVTISRPFYLGKYPVTQQQWVAVMGSNPSDCKGPQNPVESVLWTDCQAFLGRLNEKFAASRVKFDLPTEAQWEYACRAGGQGRFHFGDDQNRLADYGWFRGNADGKTHPVGRRNRTLGACTTCMATSANCAPIGTPETITGNPLRPIPRARLPATTA